MLGQTIICSNTPSFFLMSALISVKTGRHFRIFFNWDSLHARLNSHYEAWSESTDNIASMTHMPYFFKFILSLSSFTVPNLKAICRFLQIL